MKYRQATILAEKTLGTATTLLVPINLRDPISRIDLLYQPTLVSQGMLAALPVNISKVELVDGSDVLHSLSGRQNQAVCIYDRRVPTMNSGVLSGGTEAFCGLGIDFGRFLFDPELAFDPQKFENPQLKITHDPALVDASCTVHTLEIIAHCFDEKVISPIGFLQTKEHVSWQAASDGDKQDLDLPLDCSIRQIILRGWHTDVDPKTVVKWLTLREDGGKRIPFDRDLDRYIEYMKGVWPQVVEGVSDYVDNGGNYVKYVTPTDHWVSVYSLPVGIDTATELTAGSQGGKVNWRNDNTCWNTGTARGYLPHHCIQIPFGNQQDMDDWYDVTTLGSLKARVTGGANYGAGSLIELIIQQLRRY